MYLPPLGHLCPLRTGRRSAGRVVVSRECRREVDVCHHRRSHVVGCRPLATDPELRFEEAGHNLSLVIHDERCTMYHRFMRLATFELDQQRLVGAIDGDQMVDFSGSGLPNEMIELIRTWDQDPARSAYATSPRIPLSRVRLLAPLAPRKNIIAVGRNYHDHAQEF